MVTQQVKRWLSALFSRIRHFRSDQDIQEELRAHLDIQAEDSLLPGVSPEEARRRAAVRLGNPRVIVERVRDREFATIIEGWFRDLALGLRALRKRPVFCLTAIITLAIGIGANTAIFTLLYGLLLRSLPVDDPWHLARIHIVRPEEGSRPSIYGMPWSMLEQIRRQQQSFVDISAWSGRGATMPDEEGTLRLLEVTLVSGNAFSLLGMKPHLGRLLAPSDDLRGGPPEGWAVVLSYGFWNDRFHGDPQIIGRNLQISNILVTVAGITPPAFQGITPGRQAKMYLPLQFATAIDGRDRLNTPGSLFWCTAIARLKARTSLAQANAELAVYKKDLFQHFFPLEMRQTPGFDQVVIDVKSARTGLPFFAESYTQPLLLMQALVGAVLLLCCINVGGLMMSNIEARRHEFSLRTAVGAARWRLIRQYLTESFVIAAAGAVLGGVAAQLGTTSLLVFFGDPMGQEGLKVQPDSTVLLITAFFAILTTLCFGALPAWRASRANPASLLNTRHLVSRARAAGRAFVPVQVALSLALVVVAGLLSQSLIRMRTESIGFNASQVTITTPQFQRLPQKDQALLDLYQHMVDRLEQLPGIHSAAITWYTPMTGFQATSAFQAMTAGLNPPEDPRMSFNDVGPGYFRTMQTRILSGREFERSERSRDVCILNQAAAEFLFPHLESIGQYVRSNDSKTFPRGLSCRVIGVAEDAKYSTAKERAPRTVYFPVTVETAHTGNLVFLIRSNREAEAVAAYRRAHSEFVPGTALLRFATLRQQMDDLLGAQRLITTLSNVFAGLALFLSAIGLYGLLASSVARRTSEIGVRLALGARTATVLRMVLGEALRLLLIGVVVGLLSLVAAVKLIQGMLYGVSRFDPVTLIAATALLAAVAFLAAFLPARRAASVDPVQALRTE